MTITNIIVHGASGRMGKQVLAQVETDASVRWIGSLPGAWPEQCRGAVVIDFSLPEAIAELQEQCVASGACLVSGTTGLSDEQLQSLRATATEIPVLWAPNFSLGIAVLRRALKLCAELLPPSWDANLVDTHHRHKVDAPSGTAALLSAAIEQSRSPDASPVQVVSTRIGEVIGDHQICFAGPSERLELIHRADHRGLFAQGALHAAKWLQSQPPGWYSLDDCIG